MPEAADTITLDQMRGAVGSLLFLWSDIERSLQAVIQTELFARDGPPVHQLSRALSLWSQRVMAASQGRPRQAQLCRRLTRLLSEALAVRNLVCHGLVGYYAQVSHGSQEAHLLVELDTDRRVLTWSELQGMFRWMSRSRWLIEALTGAAMERDAARSEDRLRGWDEFPGPHG